MIFAFQHELLLFITPFLLYAHSLEFVPHNDNTLNQQLNLRKRKLDEPHKVTGYFKDDISSLCIEVKLEDDKQNMIGSNIWFQKCEEGKVSQLWWFDDEWEGGKLHTALNDDKCVQAQKTYRRGSRLRIKNCSDRRKTQKWELLDNIVAKHDNNITAYTLRGEKGPKVGSYLVLVGYDDFFYSMDWNSYEFD